MQNQRKNSIFSVNMIGISTFLGTPLTGGFMIAKNFLTLGQASKVKTTAILTVLASLVFFTLAAIFEDTSSEIIKIFTGTGLLGIPLATNYWAKRIQGEEISKFIEGGGEFAAFRKVATANIGGFAVASLISFIFNTIFLQNGPKMKTFRHQSSLGKIDYYSRDYIEAEVSKIADILKEENYFAQSNPKDVWLFKDNRGNHILVLSIPNDAVSDKNQLQSLSKLRDRIQKLFSSKPVYIDVGKESDLSEILKRIE